MYKGINKYTGKFVNGELIKNIVKEIDPTIVGSIDVNGKIHSLSDNSVIIGEIENGVKKRYINEYLIGVTEVDPNYLFEYVGLDRNNDRIFTGDLVRYNDKIYLICYIKDKLVAVSKSGYNFIDFKIFDCDFMNNSCIIGNYLKNNKLMLGIRILENFYFFR